MENELLNKIILYAPPLLLAVILHEIAHGWSAYKLGDPTAKLSGRLTLNPIKHIDLWMTILLPGILILSGSPVVFGGAKPVPVNAGYFKNPRKDMMLVAAAGPGTNILLALIFLLIFKNYGANLESANTYFSSLIYGWLAIGILTNAILAIFNLFPILPLDGGRIVVGLLPLPLARLMMRLEPYGLLLIFVLLYYGIFNSVLEPFIEMIYKQIA